MSTPLAARIALALVGLAAAAYADTLHVPKDFETIQAAVEASADGDTILVAGGTYVESVTVTGKAGLVLRASGKVVIDTIGAAPGLTLTDCVDLDVIGLRVVDGAGDGILVSGGQLVTLERCRVEGVAGNGIRASGTTDLLLDRCRVRDVGDTGIAAGGLGADDPCPQPVLVKCRVEDENPVVSGLLVTGDQAVVDRCRVDWPGGTQGLLCADESFVTVDRCRVVGAPLTALGSLATLTRNRVLGAELQVLGDDSVVEDNRVLGDSLLAVSAARVELRRNRVAKAAASIGIEVTVGLDAVLEDNLVTGCLEGLRVDGNSEGTLASGNVAKGSLDVGLHILGDTGTFTDNRAFGSGVDGFRLGAVSQSNTLSLNKAKGSANFDLLDLSGGANEIADDNVFPKQSP